MPVIKDLSRFLRMRLKKQGDYVRFNVIRKEDYISKKWDLSRVIDVELSKERGRLVFKVTDLGRRLSILHEEMDTRTFRYISYVKKYLESKYPPTLYTYYRYTWRDISPSFTNLKYLFGFTNDETYAWGLILARCMRHLNGRSLIGFKQLTNTSKKCEVCGNHKADVYAVFEYRRTRYGVYYCKSCWVKAVNKLIEELEYKVEHIRGRLISLVEENEDRGEA